MTSERVIETACGPITVLGMEYIPRGAILFVCGTALTYVPACKVYEAPCQPSGEAPVHRVVDEDDAGETE